jgi:hypothetical protein
VNEVKIHEKINWQFTFFSEQSPTMFALIIVLIGCLATVGTLLFFAWSIFLFGHHLLQLLSP